MERNFFHESRTHITRVARFSKLILSGNLHILPACSVSLISQTLYTVYHTTPTQLSFASV